ncbi:LPXTG cell wall anchor domain-containing protein [Glycomyces salinus]|uniref:LPXTG cell wall anchor domain-containing protein n=1 Tax=Glycomyces salinus TaxID=980294 RepID=UPI0018EB9D67|nr:LPXTG cell wall anchor domain-containing protein [Glycomyces salinus]
MALKVLIRGAGLIIAAALFVAYPMVAYAATATIDINPGNVPTTASGFETNSCDQAPGGGDDLDGWVFVLPAAAGAEGNFISVTATFVDADDVEHVLSTDTDGGIVDGEGDNKAFILAPAGWTLTGASAEVEDPDEGAFFNLTHTCPGTPPPPDDETTPPDDETTPPDDETTPPDDETTPPDDETTTPPDETTPPDQGQSDDKTELPDTLPRTGSDFTPFLLAGAGLLGVGLGLYLLMRGRGAFADRG